MLPYLKTWRSSPAFSSAAADAATGIQRLQMPDPRRELPRRDSWERRRCLTGAGILGLPARLRRGCLVELPPKQRGGGAAPPSAGSRATLSQAGFCTSTGECGVTNPAAGMELRRRTGIGVAWRRQGFRGEDPRGAGGGRQWLQRHFHSITERGRASDRANRDCSQKRREREREEV